MKNLTKCLPDGYGEDANIGMKARRQGSERKKNGN